VHDEWLKTADIRREIQVDEVVVMPTHIPGIIFIMNDNGADNHGRVDGRAAPMKTRGKN